uniref:Uncharacterized protein n=1 Tax=Hemiselmis andersenii TaxID=464988 RepID=A0A6U4W3U2_HEMAN|mmetsp:Transcript_22916/g.53280  ORF Transcript_22916/g.53280 Transcript_22916/m.53280 type:complete len:385 (+) Transcript_22916:57-1211(+)
MPPKGSESYFLEGPDTYSAGWGVLSCSGFSLERGSEDDYNEVILRCADKATMKLHKVKDAQIAYKSVHRGNQFFLQWDAEDSLLPGGMYEFVWELNGKVKVVSNKFEFRDQAPAEQQELRHPMAEENMSYSEVRATLRPPKPSWFKVFGRVLSMVRVIMFTLLSLFMKIPFFVFSASISSLRITRWFFRQWTRERQMACTCGTLCRPFGFFSGAKCTRTTVWVWVRCLLSALVCFWFVHSGAKTSSSTAALMNHHIQSGSIASLIDLTEVAFSKVQVAYNTATSSPPKGGKPAPSGKVWGEVWEAFVAMSKPFFWVLRTLAWGVYWSFGLAFPAFFSWVTLDLTVRTQKCCKCAAGDAAGGKKGKAAATWAGFCSACKNRKYVK